MEDGATPKFVIEPWEAESMAAAASRSSPSDLLPTLVTSAAASSLPRPPISNFPVVAAGIGPSSGRILIGVNVEFPGLPLNFSIHAEQFLVTNFLLHSEPRLPSFAVSAAPCGHCRQFLQELRRAPEIQILVAAEEPEPLNSLLPRRFGPNDLLADDVPLLLEPRHNGLAFHPGGSVSELAAAALEAANGAHAPYSGCASGVALRDKCGRVYKGSYLESAAYNPSLGPVHAAIVAFIVGGGGGYQGIVEAVLVEQEGGIISQEESAKLLLRTISPDCVFETFRCVSKKEEMKNDLVES